MGNVAMMTAGLGPNPTPEHGACHWTELSLLGPNPRKEPARHLRPGCKIGFMGKLKGTRTRVVARIVAGVAQRQAAAAGAGRVVSGSAVHDHGVEDQAVARRHAPPANVVPAAVGVDVWDRLQ